MGYTPKRAKPASLGSNASASRRHTLFGISESRKGRHAAPAGIRQGGSTAAPEFRAA